MDFNITIGTQFVRVGARDVSTPEIAVALCREIDSTLVRSQRRAVIFDTRQTEAPPREASAVVWQWTRAGKYHDVVAIVVQSELLRVSGNMTAVSQGASLRSFNSMSDAEKYIATQLATGPRSRRSPKGFP